MKYIKPEIEIIELNTVDVIQTSGGEGDIPGNNGPSLGENETPYG